MEIALAVADRVLGAARTLHQVRRRVRVRVHRAGFVGVGVPQYFINVTNLSAQREVVVTHVWFHDPVVHVDNPERPLPRRLKLDEPWETWAPIHLVGEGGETRARVRLSNGKAVKARAGHPPAMGSVPGAAES
jgi:hypothetical protein